MYGQKGDKGLRLEVRGLGFRVFRLEKFKVEGRVVLVVGCRVICCSGIVLYWLPVNSFFGKLRAEA